MTSLFSPYIKALRLALPLLLLVSAGLSLIAYAIVANMGATHQAHFSYLISLSEREDAGEFRFDGFYALQATDLFASTLAEWIQAPETIVASYAQAELPLPTHNSRQLTQRIRADKAASQLVQVTVRGASADESERIAQALQHVMEEYVVRYHDQGIPALHFRIVPTDTWTSVSTLSIPVIVITTFLFSLFLGMNGVLLVESIKQQKE
jgi:capsular polysaccharide biosynthesis protein